MNRNPRRWLLLAGAVLTVASSGVIEVCLVLLLTPVSTAALHVPVLLGIAGVVIGSLMMWMCSRKEKPLQP